MPTPGASRDEHRRGTSQDQHRTAPQRTATTSLSGRLATPPRRRPGSSGPSSSPYRGPCRPGTGPRPAPIKRVMALVPQPMSAVRLVSAHDHGANRLSATTSKARVRWSSGHDGRMVVGRTSVGKAAQMVAPRAGATARGERRTCAGSPGSAARRSTSTDSREQLLGELSPRPAWRAVRTHNSGPAKRVLERHPVPRSTSGDHAIQFRRCGRGFGGLLARRSGSPSRHRHGARWHERGDGSPTVGRLTHPSLARVGAGERGCWCGSEVPDDHVAVGALGLAVANVDERDLGVDLVAPSELPRLAVVLVEDVAAERPGELDAVAA